MTTVKLPNKLSELLRLAVRDAQAVEQRDGYRLDMLVFHEPRRGGSCAVCMAGAVIANTLEGDPSCDLAPADFDQDTWRLWAIDSMRQGAFVDALNELLHPNERDATRLDRRACNQARALVEAAYRRNINRAPWPVYLEAADILAKAGL